MYYSEPEGPFPDAAFALLDGKPSDTGLGVKACSTLLIQDMVNVLVDNMPSDWDYG